MSSWAGPDSSVAGPGGNPFPDGVDSAGVLGSEIHAAMRTRGGSGGRIVFADEAVDGGEVAQQIQNPALADAPGARVQQVRRIRRGAIEHDPCNLKGVGEGHHVTGMDPPATQLQRASHGCRAREGIARDRPADSELVDALEQERQQPRLVSDVAQRHPFLGRGESRSQPGAFRLTHSPRIVVPNLYRGSPRWTRAASGAQARGCRRRAPAGSRGSPLDPETEWTRSAVSTICS
jgi:hypothetical protein